MEREKFTVVSPVDGLPLSACLIRPEGKKKAIVQIVHGMCEHKERYLPFMQFLAENGFVCCAHDHRGHGDSVKSEEDLGYCYDKTGEAIVDDALAITKDIKARFPDLPVYLFGHSMGSLVVRVYLSRYAEEIDKLVVCGAPCKNPLAGVGLALNKGIALIKGERQRSKTMKSLTTGSGDKKFKGEGECAWLTRDKEVVAKYLADKKCGYTFTCNGFNTLLKLLRHTYDRGRYAVIDKTLPIFFVAGSEDPVIGSEEKWFEAQSFLRSVGYERVSGKLYHGMRHEILNEFGKEEVYADLLKFFES